MSKNSLLTKGSLCPYPEWGSQYIDNVIHGSWQALKFVLLTIWLHINALPFPPLLHHCPFYIHVATSAWLDFIRPWYPCSALICLNSATTPSRRELAGALTHNPYFPVSPRFHLFGSCTVLSRQIHQLLSNSKLCLLHSPCTISHPS